MDPELNPYTPGSGRRPPALTGRDRTIEAFDLVVARSKRGHTDRGLMLYGLRGAGKTALLNYLRNAIAAPADWVTISLEAQTTAAGRVRLVGQVRGTRFRLAPARRRQLTPTVPVNRPGCADAGSPCLAASS